MFPAYGYNYLVLTRWVGSGCEKMLSRPLAELDQPNRRIAFADSSLDLYDHSQIGFYCLNAPDRWAKIVREGGCAWWDGAHGGWNWGDRKHDADNLGFVTPRHKASTASVGYLDGHTRARTWKELAKGTNFAPGITEDRLEVTRWADYEWDPH
jgi:hypothetical protein